MIRQLSSFTHQIMSLYLKPGMTVVDATLGNGHDAVFALKAIGNSGWLHGYDVQGQAIAQAKKRLESEGLTKYSFYNRSHDHLLETFAPESVDMVIYNLGYLPNFDKTITTMLESTSKSILQALEIIKKTGLVFITSYRGHEEGQNESDWLDAFTSELDRKAYHVMQIKYANQGHDTPYLTIIEKK